MGRGWVNFTGRTAKRGDIAIFFVGLFFSCFCYSAVFMGTAGDGIAV